MTQGPKTPPADAGAESTLSGVVIRAGSGRCRVAVGRMIYRCQVRGRLKQGPQKEQSVVVVGDRVLIQPLPPAAAAAEPAGVVETVLPRHNQVSRQAARRSGGHIEQVLMANLDQVVVVQSVAAPAPQGCLVDRLLVAASRYAVPSVLCLNKIDLDPAVAADARWEYYASIGIEVVRTSTVTGAGLTVLAERLGDRISILLGASGVGKSSLLNAVEPGLRLRTGEVTGKTGLGRHTTSHTELFPLAHGGFIADSPGLRGFDPWDLAPVDLREHWPDLLALGADCRFRTCLHRDEPDCAVKRAVARGQLPAWRHQAYLDILRDLEDRQRESQPY